MIQKIFVVLSLFIASSFGFARLMKMEEASFTCLSNVSIQIKKDGSMEERIHLTYFLKKPQAMSFGTFPITYSPSYQKMNFLKAHIVTEGKTYKPQKIEDKPIASTMLEGFDARNRFVINFSHVQVGSEIHLDYIMKHKPLIPGFASIDLSSWNSFPLLKGSSLILESEIPLESLIQSFNTDFSKRVEFKKSYDSKKKSYGYSLIALKDLYFGITDENYSYNTESQPFVSFATTKSYAEMVKKLVPKFQEKIKQKLPKKFEDFLKGIKDQSLTEKVEIIMDRMMEHLRYSGDWRTVEGSFVPRDKADVAKTGYGDCKDFSLLLASLLREQGYEASQAFVFRSYEHQVTLENKLPSDSSFNHAITYVKHQGKSYWFDPTNSLSFAKRPLDDISGREALVMSEKPFLEKIPEILSFENSVEFKEEIIFLDNKKRKINLERIFHGIASFEEHKKFYQISEKEGQEILLRSTIGSFELLQTHKLVFPKKLGRIVGADLRTVTEVTYYNPLIKTTAGYGISVSSDNLIAFLSGFSPDKYEYAGIKLGDVSHRKVYSILKDKKLKSNEKVVGCEVSSPWVDYKRFVEKKGDDIIITQEINLKKEIIKNHELKSADLKKLREDLRSKVENIILVFE